MYQVVPRNLTSLFLIAITPASVNVVINIFSGFTQVFKIIFAVLRAIIWVFPVPGQATTITGQ
ncbi:MAG: hypothetical protein LBU14_04490 [Candidatus Peribacteria bacterium]|nr:hypothetical protein [Candidatus Peribacteria bacterium]